MELSKLIVNPEDAVVDAADASDIRRIDSARALNLTLHQCARDGDEESMDILLNNISKHMKKKKVNALDDEDLTPLHYAARYNNLGVVKLLLENGADPNVTGEDGITPLIHAARYRKRELGIPQIVSEETGTTIAANGLPLVLEQYVQTLENTSGSCISYLVEQGAEVNMTDIYGQTALHFAAMRGNEIAARDLLSCRGINIEAKDKQGMTPLHMAAVHNQGEVAAMLIQNNAQLRGKDHEDSTPLHYVCSEGNADIAKMILEAGSRSDADVDMVEMMLTDKDSEESTCLHLAVENGHYDVAKLCLQKADGISITSKAIVNMQRKHCVYPFHLSAMFGDVRVVKLLVQYGGDMDVMNDEQATPLHKAAQLNHGQVVKYLVDHGAKINCCDKDSYTPLLLAVTYGHVETVKLLLEASADYTAVDKSDKTVIFLAAEENKVEVLKELLSHPTVRQLVNVSDRYDNDPLHIAAQHGYIDIVETLLDNGADLDSKNEDEQTPLHLAAKYGRTNLVRMLVQKDKSAVNDEDENSNTALHLAAMQGHNKAVSLLIDFGADIADRNYNQWTPLDLAASKGWFKTCRILLEAGAPIDPMDKNQTTPLHLACRNGHASVVGLLLDWDADVTLPDADGNKSLDIAIENLNIDVAMVIVNSNVWEDALRNTSDDPTTNCKDTPIRKLITKMPDVAERVFDRCLSYGAEKNPKGLAYEITYNYEYLDDLYANWMDTKHDTASDTGSVSGTDVYDEDDKLVDEATPYTYDSNLLKKNHPLTLMVKASRDDLLAHPLVMSLLDHKWNSFGSSFYYMFFFVYSIFLIFLTGYIVLTPPPYMFNDTDEEAIRAGSCDNLSDDVAQRTLFPLIAKYVIIALAALNVLKELFQIYQAKLNYIDLTNLIDWVTYVSALLLVVDFNDCQAQTGYRYDWQWSLGATAIFLAWMDLALFIRKFPRFGIYVVMFTEVLSTVAKFFIIFVLFIMAFSLGFFALFQNQTAFRTVQTSIIKTTVMMIGEFEFDALFYDQYLDGDPETADPQERVYYEEVSYILFVVFMILMSIIMMNLLVGLSVDDIKAVREQAALKRMAMLVELVLDVEKILPDFIRRKSYVRKKTLRPNALEQNPIRQLFFFFQSSMSSKAIEKALNPELDEIEKVQEAQDKLRTDMKKVKNIMKELREQNSRVESMLLAIVSQSENIHWQEEDFQEDENEVED